MRIDERASSNLGDDRFVIIPPVPFRIDNGDRIDGVDHTWHVPEDGKEDADAKLQLKPHRINISDIERMQT